MQGTKLRDNDYVEHIITTTAHAYLLFFSNRGRVYRLRAHEIPMKDRTARGTALVNLISLQSDEHVQAVIDTRTRKLIRREPLPGCDGLPDVHVLRTLDDAERLRPVLAGQREVVVVGAGWIGAEFTTAAREAGCRVTVVEAADWVWTRRRPSTTWRYGEVERSAPVSPAAPSAKSCVQRGTWAAEA